MKLKLAAWVTVLVFSVTNTGWSAPGGIVSAGPRNLSSPVIPQTIEIPAELGTVETQYKASKDAPFVIVLQDAHAIVDAQLQAQKLLSYFQKQYGIDLVALEGGKGPMDATLFRAFPDALVRKKIMGDYLEKGEITGAEMAAVFGEKEGRYYGIEDWGLYEENYLAYARAAEKKEEALKKIRELKGGLDEKRTKIFLPALNQLHERIEAFHDEKMDLAEFLRVIAKQSRNLENYPHLTAFLDSLAGEESLSKEDLAVSIRKMAESFKVKLLPRMDQKQHVQTRKHRCDCSQIGKGFRTDVPRRLFRQLAQEAART